MNGVVLALIVLMALTVGVIIGALATRSGYRHNPPKEPGRHSRRPDGGPERRRDYLAGPMPPLGARWPDAEAVTGPMREAVRPLGGSPGPLVPGRPWHEGMSQPETRAMGAVRPSPQQDMARWREQQEQGGA